MTNRLDSPLLDEHDHHHDGDGHHHHHDHDHELNIAEEPLDPASQSLSDALKASFRVLKGIMVVVVIIFAFSGLFSVGTNEMVVVSRLGRHQEPVGPGLHWAFPYPIDELIKVQTSAKTLEIKSFWFTLNRGDESRSLSDLEPRGNGLDPATDGALLTGDRAIMNIRYKARYVITNPKAYVRNVGAENEDHLLQSVLKNAAVAEAARTTAEEIRKDVKSVAKRIQSRAQDALAALDAGITLEDVTGDQAWYPLQTKSAFLNVSTAENSKNEAIQGALSEQTKKLNGVAGEAWRDLSDRIGLLDQAREEAQRQKVLNEISQILSEKATGESGGKVKMAQNDREKVIADTQAQIAGFEALLPAYRENPELVRQRLRQKMLSDLFAQTGVNRWFLPAGDKQIMLWLNKDPVQAREDESRRLKEKAGVR